jgi:hypothetical protein
MEGIFYSDNSILNIGIFLEFLKKIHISNFKNVICL